MTQTSYVAVPVTRYVLAVAAVMVVILVFTLGIIYLFDPEIPSGAGTIKTMVAIIAGVSWFSQKVNRPMMVGERLRFAAGVALVNVVIPAGYFLVALLLVGLPLSIEGVDQIFGGSGFLTGGILTFFAAFAAVVSFAQAYFFAWMLTRKLPKNAGKPGLRDTFR
jgi:hypothetical protein